MKNKNFEFNIYAFMVRLNAMKDNNNSKCYQKAINEVNSVALEFFPHIVRLDEVKEIIKAKYPDAVIEKNSNTFKMIAKNRELICIGKNKILSLDIPCDITTEFLFGCYLNSSIIVDGDIDE